MDSLHGNGSRCFDRSSGAQRLSATLMDSLTAWRICYEPGGHRRCSTPFGDIDGFTKLRTVGWHAFRRLTAALELLSRSGAQRLSATLMDSQTVRVPATVLNVGQRWYRFPLCSTPFGDIDGFTDRRCCLSATIQDAVIRRLPCSTPFGDIDGFTPRLAKPDHTWSSKPSFHACGSRIPYGASRDAHRSDNPPYPRRFQRIMRLDQMSNPRNTRQV